MKATYQPPGDTQPRVCARCRLEEGSPEADAIRLVEAELEAEPVPCDHEWLGGPKLTLGLGDDDPDAALVITAEPVNVPAKFKGACRKHPDVTTTGK